LVSRHRGSAGVSFRCCPSGFSCRGWGIPDGIGSAAVRGRRVFRGNDDSFHAQAVALTARFRVSVETVVFASPASLAVMVQWADPGTYEAWWRKWLWWAMTQRGHVMPLRRGDPSTPLTGGLSPPPAQDFPTLRWTRRLAAGLGIKAAGFRRFSFMGDRHDTGTASLRPETRSVFRISGPGWQFTVRKYQRGMILPLAVRPLTRGIPYGSVPDARGNVP